MILDALVGEQMKCNVLGRWKLCFPIRSLGDIRILGVKYSKLYRVFRPLGTTWFYAHHSHPLFWPMYLFTALVVGPSRGRKYHMSLPKDSSFSSRSPEKSAPLSTIIPIS